MAPVSYLQIENLTKSYGDRMLFADVTFGINQGDKIGLIAKNGTGKTTMLRIIAGIESPDSGTVTRRSGLKVALVEQVPDLGSDGATALSACRWEDPDAATRMLSQLGISDPAMPVATMSGGQRKRVAIARALLHEPDLLILDEPTNHLDITSKEILENALCRYTGTVLYVSHDRYFINRTATRILDLTGQHLNEYKGNYDYYLEKKDVVEETYAKSQSASGTSGTLSSPQPAPADNSKADWQAKKEEQSRIRKKANDLKRLEEAIAGLEERSREIDDELCRPEIATDAPRCMALAREQEKIAAELEEQYARWESLAE